MFHAGDQVLGLEGFAQQFVGFDQERPFGHRAIDYSGHQYHRRLRQRRMVLDVLADFIAVFSGHDHVGDHDIGLGLFDLAQGAGGIVAGNHVDVFPTEGDLDHLAHGRAVVDEIDSGGRAHQIPPSALSWAASSHSRRASSISSVADLSTVRVAALAPGTNLYEPVSTPLQYFTICTTASSPIRSPLSACVTLPFSKKIIPSMSPAFTESDPVWRECTSICTTPGRSR